MRKEFTIRFLKRAALFLPIGAIFILLSPVPIAGKVAGMAAVLGALLIAQLAELAVVVRNEARKDDSSPTVAEHPGDTRRQARAAARRK